MRGVGESRPEPDLRNLALAIELESRLGAATQRTLSLPPWRERLYVTRAEWLDLVRWSPDPILVRLGLE